ncbi:MAG TPA: TetR/AcrR family transcriptional regulator [Candidatus Dormibacteraeota bacterium]|nr:TetR/AcrR family transcriptional regulator [Candidatus Dormibacteraeota bacterium]
MTTSTRRTVEERRDQLLELGLRLFGSKPYDEISIDEIARLAGTSKGLLYHYFPSKRDFYVACLRAASVQLRRLMRPDPGLPPMEQVRCGLSVYLDHVKANPAKNEALLRGGIGSDPEVLEVMEETRRAVWESLLAGMRASADEHLLRFAVRGWVRFVEVMALDWARSDAVEKAALIDVCLGVLTAAVERSRAAR